MNVTNCKYPNLQRELGSAGLDMNGLAKHLHISRRTMRLRLFGAPPGFSMKELRRLKQLFPHRTLEYLLFVP